MAGFVPHTDADVAAMLGFLGLSGLDELYAVVPAAIRHAGLDLPAAMSEADVVETLAVIGARTRRPAPARSASPAAAPTTTRSRPSCAPSPAARSSSPPTRRTSRRWPRACCRRFLSTRRWSPASPASRSPTPRSMTAPRRSSRRRTSPSRRRTTERVVCSQGVNPRWLAVLRTFAKGTRHDVEIVALRDGMTDFGAVSDEPAGAVVVGYPNYLGVLEDLDAAAAAARRTGALLIVSQDPIVASLVLSPGAHGADVVVGEGQALGSPLGFGGPYLGLFSCKQSHVRRLPGRLVGETVDVDGRRAYVTTLRAREQDIRREKASSNVCTNQTLMAVTAAIQLGWLGTDGLPRGRAELRAGNAVLPRVARRDRRCRTGRTSTVRARIRDPYATRRGGRHRAAFGRGVPRRDRLTRGLRGQRSRRRAARRRHRAADEVRDRRLRGRVLQGDSMSAPTRSPGGRAASAPLMGRETEPTIFEISAPGRSAYSLRTTEIPKWGVDELIPAAHRRPELVALPDVAERDLVAHYTRLSHRQYSVDLGAYPLGSCTMKYNPKACDEVAALPRFRNVHPATPPSASQGWLQILVELEEALCEVTGMAAATLQPAAGAAGELTGLLLIRAYHARRNDERTRVIIPDSAHGTNPASVTLGGYAVSTVGADRARSRRS